VPFALHPSAATGPRGSAVQRLASRERNTAQLLAVAAYRFVIGRVHGAAR